MNRRPFRLLALAGVITAIAAISPAVASAQWFSPTSFWNTPLSPAAPLDARSSAWVQHLVDKVNNYGDWINTSQYSVPIYTAASNQHTVPVTMDNYSSAYTADFQKVPIPSGAKPAAGTDHHLVISQPSTDAYWEFWDAYQAKNGAWHAGSGTKISNVSLSSGIAPLPYFAWFPSPYGATATNLGLVGGLMLPSELQAGLIPHVVALAIPHPLLRYWWSAPALRSDGDSQDPCDIPEGTIFRLPSSLNVYSLGLSPVATTIALAVQQYGMVVRDTAGSVAFYAQDPTNMSTNPYPSLFNGESPSQVLAGFPWSQLQALQSQPNQALPNPSSGSC